MSTDRRDQVAEALELWDSDRAGRIADIILPTVERLCAEAAAEALEQAAGDPKLVGLRSTNPSAGTPGWLRARAAALNVKTGS